jgi:hypothetical protein
MKLYTEEQVRDILQSGSFPFNDDEVDEIISMITFIELPSDEEVHNIAASDDGLFYEFEFIEGANWVINKIKQQAIT